MRCPGNMRRIVGVPRARLDAGGVTCWCGAGASTVVREVGPMVGLGRQESSYTIAVADLNQVGAQCLDWSPRSRLSGLPASGRTEKTDRSAAAAVSADRASPEPYPPEPLWNEGLVCAQHAVVEL